MNKDLLFQLYAIHSPSGNEKKMRKFIRKQAYACGATSVETDKHGNLLIVKGESETYPCLAAHMDQVQRDHSKDFQVFEHNGIAFAFSAKSMEQQGLGADDKNGIFVCLECLKKFDVLKLAFFVGEETGCIGSNKVDLAFFKDCRFIIEPDRMNGHDLITSMFCGQVCSDDFIKAIGADKYGYKEERGSVTDVGELTERGVNISCLNLSCGYYHPHTSEEVTNLAELENCLNFVQHIVETCTDAYPFEGGYGDFYGGYYGGYNYYGGYGGKSKNHSLYYEDDFDATKWYEEGGYYDEDVTLMEEYLEVQPDLTADDVLRNYVSLFSVNDFFDYEDDVEYYIRTIYAEAKKKMASRIDISTFWDDDDEVVVEPKKVS